jgi:hypothetical protein
MVSLPSWLIATARPSCVTNTNIGRTCTEFATMLGLIKSAHHSARQLIYEALLGLINSVKSPASAANPPLPEIDSNIRNDRLDAACNLISYKKSKQI